ncbi:MAG: NAD(P)-binding protein [Bacillota bacterium]
MKVCIIGAGLSGLSCALTLEKYGVEPDIYEQFDRCGGRVPFIICLLQIIHRPVADHLIDLARNYGINITPINTLNYDKVIAADVREDDLEQRWRAFLDTEKIISHQP